MQNPERQGTKSTGDVCPEYFNIQDLSRYLSIKTSSLYSMIGEKKIPHYRVGKLIRFRRSEIDLWMEGNKKGCVAPERVARKALGPIQKHKIDIDRVVQKAIEETRGQGYTKPHGKPDQVKGLGKEVHDGSV
ncbi:MAG: helix-turn-helix domain-containing protein [Deltaproteobacteria bacterium]|nr:helix-turn-helix domain-containing protein [Deltaproteobacteria bacterium]